MKAMKCHFCGRLLDDWEGNILVDNLKMSKERVFDKLTVACKTCSREDERDICGRTKHHNLWELRWIRDDFNCLLAGVISDMSANDWRRKKWSFRALRDLLRIARYRFPGTQAKSPLHFL